MVAAPIIWPLKPHPQSHAWGNSCVLAKVICMNVLNHSILLNVDTHSLMGPEFIVYLITHSVLVNKDIHVIKYNGGMQDFGLCLTLLIYTVNINYKSY